MITVYEFKNDQIQRLKFEHIRKALAWIRVVDPTDNEIRQIEQRFKIPRAELQESKEEEERPKITPSNRYLEIIYRAPVLSDGEIQTVPFYIYLFKEKIITIEKDKLSLLNEIETKVKNNKAKYLFKRRLPYFVFHLLDKINDDFLLKIDKIAASIDIYEEVTKRTLTQRDIEKVYELSVTLSFFNQALIANLEVLNALRKGYFKVFTFKDKELFEELYFDALQILDTEKIQREALSNLFNLQAIIASTRLNNFINKLTIIALIVAIPTMLSGIYGMNIALPLQHHPQVFWILLVFMLGVSALVTFIFRRIDWL